MRQLMITALAAVAILLPACNAPFSSPTDSGNDTDGWEEKNSTTYHPDTVLAHNGFVTGEEVPRYFNFDKNEACALYSPQRKTTEIKMAGLTVPEPDYFCSTSVHITIPGSRRGEFPWDDMLLGEEDEASTVIITIAGVRYYSQSGSTKIILYRDYEGSIVGTYSGVLKSVQGQTLAVKAGQFEAPF